MNEQEPGLGTDDGRIERWLTDRPGRPPFPDRDAVLRRTLQRLPSEPQRRRWWPFRWPSMGRTGPRTRGSTGDVPSGTVRAMPGAAGLVAALVVLSVGAIAILSAAPLDRSLAPAAAPVASPGPEAAAFFTGSMPAGIPMGGESSILGEVGTASSVTLRRGVTLGQVTVRASDPRFAGRLSIDFNDERYGPTATVGTIWGTQRIENDEGAWDGAFVGSGTSVNGGASMRAMVMGRYTGEGAFEGLAAIVFFDLGDDSFEGVIIPAALAPPPS